MHGMLASCDYQYITEQQMHIFYTTNDLQCGCVLKILMVCMAHFRDKGQKSINWGLSPMFGDTWSLMVRVQKE